MEQENRHDLHLNNFATISGIRGKQFGREIFSTVIQFKDLLSFLSVFPEVQRDCSNRRINSIKKYILSGLEDESKTVMRFFSAITATARGSIFFDEERQRLAIDTKHSKLSINDGQHRFYGISEAIQALQAIVNRTSDEVENKKIYEKLIELREMVIPIVIFNNISEAEEKQLFHDLNNLAQRPSRSATIRLAQTDLFAKMSRELAEENVYLQTYGVEMDKMSIHKSNPNLVLLTTIHYVLNELVEASNESLIPATYEMHKSNINNVFDSIFKALPDDVNVKGKYIIEKNYAFKGIAKFIAQVKINGNVEDRLIYQAIQETDFTSNFANWSKYGATEGSSGALFAGDGGMKAVIEELTAKLNQLSVSVMA